MPKSGLLVVCAWMSASIVLADETADPMQHFRAKLEGANCISDFKKDMNDPSFFQLKSDFAYDTLRTDVLRRAHEASYLNVAEVVVFTARIRAKNEFGGLVLRNLSCEFSVNSDNSLSFIRSLPE